MNKAFVKFSLATRKKPKLNQSLGFFKIYTP